MRYTVRHGHDGNFYVDDTDGNWPFQTMAMFHGDYQYDLHDGMEAPHQDLAVEYAAKLNGVPTDDIEINWT